MNDLLRRHTTGHYIRGYGAVDMANPGASDELTVIETLRTTPGARLRAPQQLPGKRRSPPPLVAAPLGFMAFALATCLYMTSQAGLTESATQVGRGWRFSSAP